jgi:hypothetical protein
MTERHVRWIGAIILILCVVVATQYVRAAALHGTNTTSTASTVAVPDASQRTPSLPFRLDLKSSGAMT